MNRREVLQSGGLLAASPRSGAAAPGRGSIGADLARYAGFGIKRTGGPGDQAVGEWLEARLQALGFATGRQHFEAPFLDLDAAALQVGGIAAPLLPQAPWRLTGPTGVEGPLRPWPESADVRGAVAVLTLPSRRWAAFKVKEIEPPVRAALAAGAAAVLIVTTGPTGEGVALNAALDLPEFRAPVAVLAPADAARIAAPLRDGATARVTLSGRETRRTAFNVVGRLDRGRGRWLVISTPRSGWFTCAAERGSGVAVWLDMAAWAARTLSGFDILMTSASGHEREYAGAKLFLKSGGPPPPARTSFWLHLGANVAARDWHDLTPVATPLPSADAQRYLVVDRALLPTARDAFRGQAGLEAPYASDQMADGELGEILAAGYAHSAGVFGAHRFFHTQGDQLRCTDAALTEAAVRGFRILTAAALRRRGQGSGSRPVQTALNG